MANETQIKLWNESNAARWLKLGDAMTRPLEPFGQAAIEALTPRRGEKVLDIGCGTGETTRALAALTGDALGIDVCEPFVEIARSKGGARYLLADAQTHRFDEQFDLLFSRFGVMFFDDPAAAFANLHSALRRGARVALAVWGPWQENQWAAIPIDVLRELMPAPDPAGPGPFGLADEAKLRRVLAGFANVSIQRLERPFEVDPAQLADQGPAAAVLRQSGASAEIRSRFIDGVTRALGGKVPKAVGYVVSAIRP
ncbi:MAG: methyltransferase domain-containing protein [Myxococcales bacterium]|nr:methyltransferase domain-containing protein [Myxococcales bacterium]